MTLLSAQDLRVQRAGHVILDGISLVAQPGEFIAVIGPNGAGKSTLLRVLAGLQVPERGSVTLAGKPLTQGRMSTEELRQLARQRAFLPQGAHCEWPIAVERLVGLGLTPSLPALGDFTAADSARIDSALEACDLLAQRRQSVTTLSGGELARAMLARALVGDPQVLMVDEPLAGLDPRHTQDAARRLQQLASVHGKLVIASVHELTIALRRASRVWAIKGGRLLADGPAVEVMTAGLLRELFDLEACVAGSGARAYVDF
jgi:iron complex transport system ATP-binding protein